MAKALQKPFYVAVESYKFARMYPLSQRDAITSASVGVPQSSSYSANSKVGEIFGPAAEKLMRESPLTTAVPGQDVQSKKVSFELPSIDFTPAHLLTLLFTDLGVFTPAAVSEELIRLYQ